MFNSSAVLFLYVSDDAFKFTSVPQFVDGTTRTMYVEDVVMDFFIILLGLAS
jgi:hypothetical protein